MDLSRLGTLIKSNINDLISKAEDPEKMLNQVLTDMKNQLVEAKKQVAVAIGDEKRLKKQWDEQIGAVQGVGAQGHDGRARRRRRAWPRRRSSRQKEHDDLRSQFEQQWHLQKDAVDKLKDQLRILNNKIEEAKRKKNILVARAKRAEAQQTIQSTMAGLSDTSAFDTFDRMAEKVDAASRPRPRPASELAGELTGDTLAAQVQAARDRRRRRRHGAGGAQGQDGPRPCHLGRHQGAAQEGRVGRRRQASRPIRQGPQARRRIAAARERRFTPWREFPFTTPAPPPLTP